jgi:multidrug resistance efflux pump
MSPGGGEELAPTRSAAARLQDAIDAEALDLAEARLGNTHAAARADESSPAGTELKAEFAGIVSEVCVRAGEFVGPGQPIALLADLSELIVETTDLNEIDVALEAFGDSAEVTFDVLPGIGLQCTQSYFASKAVPGNGVN